MNETARLPARSSGVVLLSVALSALMAAIAGCGDESADVSGTEGPLESDQCVFVENGFGPDGTVPIQAEEVVSGLDVPWAIGFISADTFLVTERPGRIRLVEKGALIPEPVASVSIGEIGEGGLLGLALDPAFDSNRFFYVYYTTVKDGRTVNRVERFHMDSDLRSAQSDRILIDDIPASPRHDGGRIHFGPDGLLYIGTGDAGEPSLAQNQSSLAGKILRLNSDGSIPSGNPFGADNPAYLMGIRNTQGFDWINNTTLVVTDHGPTGELGGRGGGDEVSLAIAGSNLGWPDLWRCQERSGRVTPLIAWEEALPPGGATLYTGESIAEWRGDLIIAALGARMLQRVSFTEESGSVRVESNEVYLRGEFGRLREAIMGPDGHLYVTTSNCDGRGTCGAQKDRILRIRGR